METREREGFTSLTFSSQADVGDPVSQSAWGNLHVPAEGFKDQEDEPEEEYRLFGTGIRSLIKAIRNW